MKILWRAEYVLAKFLSKNVKIISLDEIKFHIIKIENPNNFIAKCGPLGICIGPLYKEFDEEIKKAILYHELAHYFSIINFTIKIFSMKRHEDRKSVV